MRALFVRRHGGPEVLEVREAPDPEPGPGDAVVRVSACGLNFAEVMARQGMYPDAPKPPCVLGYEGAGVVEATGSDVTSVEVGDRVLFVSRFGAHAELVRVPAAQAVVMPEGMSFEDGAAIPINYLTAYHMLFEITRIRSGDHVLVHMAAGGVGTAALQLCRTVEGVVTYGTASARKHDHLREHGCDYPIDYQSLDYVEEVRRLTGGRGVDVVLDPLGGPDWKKGYSLLRPAGTLVVFGFANLNRGGERRLIHALSQVAQMPRFTPLKVMADNRAIAGVNVGRLWGEIDLMRRELVALVDLYVKGAIRPHLHGAFPFDRAADAFGEVEYGRNVGKVLLIP